MSMYSIIGFLYQVNVVGNLIKLILSVGTEHNIYEHKLYTVSSMYSGCSIVTSGRESKNNITPFRIFLIREVNE